MKHLNRIIIDGIISNKNFNFEDDVMNFSLEIFNNSAWGIFTVIGSGDALTRLIQKEAEVSRFVRVVGNLSLTGCIKAEHIEFGARNEKIPEKN